MTWLGVGVNPYLRKIVHFLRDHSSPGEIAAPQFSHKEAQAAFSGFCPSLTSSFLEENV